MLFGLYLIHSELRYFITVRYDANNSANRGINLQIPKLGISQTIDQIVNNFLVEAFFPTVFW